MSDNNIEIFLEKVTYLYENNHSKLLNRDIEEQHPISAITDLKETLDSQSGDIEKNTESLKKITKVTTIKSTDTVIADLNDYTEVGSYIVYQSQYGVSNSPTTFSFSMDIVYAPQGGKDAPDCGRMQIAYVGAGDVYRNIYIRKTSDGVNYADWGGVNTINWDTDNEYRADDICFYQGVIYTSLSSGNKGNTPPNNLGTKWKLYGVKSINGMSGDVVLTTNNIAEENNLYFTQDRVTNNSSVLQNTAKVGITTQQASDILANNDKRSFTQADDDRLANTSNTNTGDQDISGKADLVDGKVPASQLPASVDEIIEEPTFADFPAVGETNKIYLALDTNKTYRWGGTQYVAVNESLALGETPSTAYRGDRGVISYDHSQKTSDNPHNVNKTDIGLNDVDNTSDIAKPISTLTQDALDTKVPRIDSIDNNVPRFNGIIGSLSSSSLTILDSGFIGINNTNPDQDLTLKNGNIGWNYSVGGTDYGSKTIIGKGSADSPVVFNTMWGGTASNYIHWQFDTNGTTAMTIRGDSTMKLSDGVGVKKFSDDGTLVGNSDSTIPTEKAIKTYVDNTNNNVQSDYTESDITSDSYIKNKPEQLVNSINTKTGDVVLSTADIAEDTNLYYTNERVSANTDVANNTAKVGITTAQASAITANTEKLNNLDKLTTQGDLLTRTATENTRLGIGTNGQFLSSDGTNLAWTDPVGGGSNFVTVAPSNTSQEIKDSADYVCDGTDDEVQINDAMLYIKSTLQGAGTVYLLSGSFNTNDTITMQTSVNLIGQGDTSGVSSTIINTLTTAIGIQMAPNCNVSFLRLICADVSTTVTRGMYLSGGAGSTISLMYAKGYKRGFESSSSNGFCTLKSCIAEDCEQGFYYLQNGRDLVSTRTSSSRFTSGNTYGYKTCYNLINCTANGTSATDLSDRGFYTCREITDCSATYCKYGFYSCYPVSNSMSNLCTFGFHSMYYYPITGCRATNSMSDGFVSCYQVSSCTSHDHMSDGFYNCLYLSSCLADSDVGVRGFSNCDYLTSCESKNHLDNEFYNCNYISTCSAEPSSSATGEIYEGCTNVTNSKNYEEQLGGSLNISGNIVYVAGNGVEVSEDFKCLSADGRTVIDVTSGSVTESNFNSLSTYHLVTDINGNVTFEQHDISVRYIIYKQGDDYIMEDQFSGFTASDVDSYIEQGNWSCVKIIGYVSSNEVIVSILYTPPLTEDSFLDTYYGGSVKYSGRRLGSFKTDSSAELRAFKQYTKGNAVKTVYEPTSKSEESYVTNATTTYTMDTACPSISLTFNSLVSITRGLGTTNVYYNNNNIANFGIGTSTIIGSSPVTTEIFGDTVDVLIDVNNTQANTVDISKDSYVDERKIGSTL